MVPGKCHLCDQIRDLHDSHVWPSFGYKRFAADQSKGGRFVDLLKQRLSNQQYKRSWFCTDCEQVLSSSERYAAEFCTLIERAPQTRQNYDERLLRFAASISWRTLKFHSESFSGGIGERRNPSSLWKRYLRGTRTGLNPFTQHLFLLTDPTHTWDRTVGGIVFENEGFVISQIGPLLMVGHLNDTQKFHGRDHVVWTKSKLRTTGGTISPLTEWHVDRRDWPNGNITEKLAGCLLGNQAAMIERAASVKWT